MMGKLSILTSLVSISLSLAGKKMMKQSTVQVQKESRELTNPRPSHSVDKIAVLIPARNEEKYIEECLELILRQDYPDFEIIVIDDDSRDTTPAILAHLQKLHPDKLKVVHCILSSSSWVGKNNALWQGFGRVSSDARWLLFLDADTKLRQTNTLRLAVDYLHEHSLDFLSLIPGARPKGFWQRLLIPEIIKFYTFITMNPFHQPVKGSVEEATASGAFILVDRKAYEQIGGHASVKNSVIEDVALARLFRSHNFSTNRIWGAELVSMTPFEAGLGDLWESIGKNIFLAGDKNWLSVVYTIGVEWVYVVAPFYFLTAQFVSLVQFEKLPTPLLTRQKCIEQLLNVVACGLVLQIQGEVNEQLHIPKWYSPLCPFAAFLTSLLTLYSAFRVSFQHTVRWKGRKVAVI